LAVADPTRPRRIASAIAIAVLPAIATLAIVHLRLDASLHDFVPSVWNDQVGYWTRILSFSDHGLSTGYYAPDEQLASITANRFGVQGPFFPMTYGTAAAVFGWSESAPIFYNLAFLGIALGAFVYVGRLGWAQAALTALLALSFGPLLLYAPTGSQESFHQAIAIVLALAFTALIARRDQLPQGWRLAILGFLLAASLVRFSWTLLLVPFAFLAYPPAGWRRALLELGAVAALTGAVLLFFGALTPPGQNSILITLSALPDAPGKTSQTVASDAWENVKQLFGPDIVDVTPVAPAPNAISVQALVLCALLTLSIAVATGAVKRLPGVIDSPDDEVARREWLFHAYNLGSMLVAVIVLYLPAGYYRVLGANLLLSLLVMVRFRRFAPVAAVGAIAVLTLPSLLSVYDGWRPNFEFDREEVDAQREALGFQLRYEPDPPSPWCNSLLLPVANYDYRVTLIPAGIGVSYLVSDTFETIDQPLKSRYVLLDDASVRDGVPASLDPPLREIGTSAAGRLYENPGSECSR